VSSHPLQTSRVVHPLLIRAPDSRNLTTIAFSPNVSRRRTSAASQVEHSCDQCSQRFWPSLSEAALCLWRGDGQGPHGNREARARRTRCASRRRSACLARPDRRGLRQERGPRMGAENRNGKGNHGFAALCGCSALGTLRSTPQTQSTRARFGHMQGRIGGRSRPFACARC